MATKKKAKQKRIEAPSELPLGKIVVSDATTFLKSLPDNSIDLIFADPPFNIGYEYDSYDDTKSDREYLDWVTGWICECWRALKPTGSFWLAMCDEYAAECKVISTANGELPSTGEHARLFYLANWVIWYYTFGVCCTHKFSRSHTHLLHFSKAKKPTVYPDAVRVPSARQLTYDDPRASAAGKSPDNTWILNPAEAPKAFQLDHDVWHVPRVAGTFKARAHITTTQMPEQILGRIIRYCTQPGDIVLDPFSGSGTTQAVAKKLNRQWLGSELSEAYAKKANKRVWRADVGDELD